MTTPTTVQVRFQFRADTAANWTSINPVLLANELGRETNTGKVKIGNGSDAWNSLAYQPWGAQISNADIATDAEIAVSKLANGTANQILTTDGTDVSWTDNPTIAGNVIITGNLTVNGTETIINVDTLQVEDKTIEMGNVATPTDLTADGGGIVLKGASNKTILWVDSTDSWTSSENIDLASGKTYKIAGTDVLSATALGSGVTDSSLTSVGNLTDLTVDTTTLVVDATNNRVGIGTNAPNDDLEIRDTIAALRLTDSDTNAYTRIVQDFLTTRIENTGAADIRLLNNGSERLRITSTGEFEFIGAGTAGASEAVYFSGSAPVDSLVIDSYGRVGLGTASPAYLLEVEGTGDDSAVIAVNETGSGNPFLFTQSTTENLIKSDSGLPIVIQSRSSDDIVFRRGSSESARIDGSGRLLVGTTTALNAGSTVELAASTPTLTLHKNQNIGAANSLLSQIWFSAGNGTYDAGARIAAVSEGAWTAGSSAPSRLVFATSADGLSSPTTHMTIKSDGKVGIGQTSPGALLDVNGDALINGLTIGMGAGSLAGNTAIGESVLGNATTGSIYNTGVGETALYEATTGEANVAVGARALYNNVAGNNGVAIGTNSQRYANNTATGWTNTNVSVGYQSLRGSTTAADNTGTNNVAIGYSSMLSNTSGDSNIAIGYSTLDANTTGTNNVAVGANALSENTTGGFNVAVGRHAFFSSVAVDQCTAIGYGSQRYADDTTTNKDGNNTSVGYNALRGSPTAADNTGVNNTAVGVTALYDNTSGNFNVAIGAGALVDNTTGNKNVAVGNNSLYKNTTGIENSALGHDAGRYEQDGSDDANFDNCTYLGHDTRASGNNQVQLGDSATTTYAYGSVQDRSDERDKADIRDTVIGLDFINTLRPVDFRWDMRDDYFDTEVYEEEEIETVEVPNPAYVEGGDEPEFIEETRTTMVTKDRLVPVAKDGSRKRNRFHHGLIAQEVKAAADAAGVDFAGYQDHSVGGGKDVLTLGYSELIAPLIKAVQELTAENAALKARLDAAGL